MAPYFKVVMKYILIVFVFLISYRLYGQKSDFKVLFGLEYKLLYQNSFQEINKRVDPVIKKVRPADTLSYFSPFNHAAVYVAPAIGLVYKDKYKLIFSGFFEQRAWSYGWNNKFFNNAYSKINLNVVDTIRLFDKNIRYYFDMGDLYNNNEFEFGLRAYNLNVQGVNSKICIGGFNLAYLFISDMAESVGLNIKQYSRIRTGHTFKFDNNNRYLNTSISVDKYKLLKNRIINDIQNRYSMGIASSLSLNKNMSFNLIIDLLRNENMGRRNSTANIAFLLKARLDFETPKSKWIILPAFRFYGINYISENYESSYFGSEYRYGNNSSTHPFYPLEAYYRPVSQFALYSEYRDISDIFCGELEVKWDYNYFKKLNQRINIELFNIHRLTANYGHMHNYYFYTYYLYVEFFENLNAGIYISNKQYNQDVQYMSFYQMEYPFFGFHFSYTGKFKKKIFIHD